MSDDQEDAAVWRWFKNGPDADDGLVGWFFGLMLWWRMWAVVALMMAPLTAGIWVYSNYDPGAAILVTWVLCMLLSDRMMKINPKYSIEQNW